MTPDYVYHSEEILVKKIGGFSNKVLIVRLRTHSQNKTVAARQTAEKKTVGHLS